MTAHKYEECEKCEEHKAWEERMKILDTIPGILTWINQSKGGLKVIYWAIGLGLPILFSLIVLIRAETNNRIDKREESENKNQSELRKEVVAISQSTLRMEGMVGTLVETSRLISQSRDKELASMKEDIAQIKQRNKQ